MVITNKWTYLFVGIVSLCNAAYLSDDDNSNDGIDAVLSPNPASGQLWLNNALQPPKRSDPILCSYTLEANPTPPKRQRTMSMRSNSPSDTSAQLQSLESRLALATNKTAAELQLLQKEQTSMKKQYGADLASIHDELNQLRTCNQTASTSLETMHQELSLINDTMRTLIAPPVSLSDLQSQRDEVLHTIEPKLEHMQERMQHVQTQLTQLASMQETFCDVVTCLQQMQQELKALQEAQESASSSSTQQPPYDLEQMFADIKIHTEDIHSIRRSLALLQQQHQFKVLQQKVEVDHQTLTDLVAVVQQLRTIIHSPIQAPSCSSTSSSSSSSYTLEDDLPALQPITRTTRAARTSMESLAKSWMKNLYPALSRPLCSERGIERAQQLLEEIPDKTSPLAQRIRIGIANTYIKLGKLAMARQLFERIDSDNLGEQTYGTFKVPSAQTSYDNLRERLFP
jgi:predicted nuclease with TOPRIM domain